MLNVLEALDFVEVETDLPWQSQRSDLQLFLRNPASFNISLAPPPLLQALMFRVQWH